MGLVSRVTCRTGCLAIFVMLRNEQKAKAGHRHITFCMVPEKPDDILSGCACRLPFSKSRQTNQILLKALA